MMAILSSGIPAADVVLNLLLQVTAVSLTVLAVARLALRGHPAARHAVLACALVVIWLGPLWLTAARLTGLPRVQLLPEQMVASGARADSAAAASGLADPGAMARESVAHPRSDWPLVLVAWAAGSVFLLLRLGYGWMVIRRLQSSARAVERADLNDVLDDVCRNLRLRDLPLVLATDRAGTPLAIGLWRPCVLLPDELVRQLPTGELRQVLAHECAHAMRRDPAMVLLQRLTAAVFWVHPLIHLVNRDLSQAREEVCDNHVLRVAGAAQYSRTLLRIAESMKPEDGVLSVALLPWQWSLEHRIRGILSERRDRMTRASRWIVAATAVGLGTMATLAGCAGERGGSSRVAVIAGGERQAVLPHVVPYELGHAWFRSGDGITITQLTGSSEKIRVGETYIVRGHYKLASAEKACLAFFVTARNEESGKGPTESRQRMTVSRGEGDFMLAMKMATDGYPHVSFYPLPSGEGFGGVYFGQGESVLRKGWKHEGASPAQ